MFLTPVALLASPAAISVGLAATNNGFDPWTLIGSVITPVIVVFLLITGKLRTGAEAERIIADNADLRAQNQALQAGLVDRVIPALTRSTLVLEGLDATRFRRDAGDG